MSQRTRPAIASILTLGCKLNIADSENMARRLREAGWRVSDTVERDADAVIINSCSVTHIADRKSRGLVRQARREAPAAAVALTGCMLETAAPAAIEALGADVVMRQRDQLALADRLIELGTVAAPGASPASGPGPAAIEPGVSPRLKTRAFISAQEGCNDVCSFCIIPRTRGRERSKSIDDVLAEARAREAEGVQEIVVTGTQLGAYGRDLSPAQTPYALLSALLDGTAVPRIRMSSLQPQDITGELVSLWRSPRLCRHFHLALQSGSGGVLQRMRRRYTVTQYRDAVVRLRARVPEVAITTDAIAGFPGETADEFEECVSFCREMAFAGIHVFPYSQREHTLAARLPGAVDEATKKQRVHRLIELAGQMSDAYRRRFIGATLPVLWETRRDGVWEGLTDTYIRVQAASDEQLTNRLTPALVVQTQPGGLRAEVVSP